MKILWQRTKSFSCVWKEKFKGGFVPDFFIWTPDTPANKKIINFVTLPPTIQISHQQTLDAEWKSYGHTFQVYKTMKLFSLHMVCVVVLCCVDTGCVQCKGNIGACGFHHTFNLQKWTKVSNQNVVDTERTGEQTYYKI